MYACGLRAGEAVALEIRAIDGINLQLKIIGKGNKQRIVPLPRAVLYDLRKFWKTHKNPRWLFPNKAGTGPIGRGALNRAFSLAARAAGITGSTPHSLRHYSESLIIPSIGAAPAESRCL